MPYKRQPFLCVELEPVEERVLFAGQLMIRIKFEVRNYTRQIFTDQPTVPYGEPRIHMRTPQGKETFRCTQIEEVPCRCA